MLPPDPVYPTPIGRDAELALGRTFLDDKSPAPLALVFDGEPGIGKSTLWRTLVADAVGRGHRVLSAAPAESEAKLSHSGLTDLLASVKDEELDALPPMQRRALEVALLRAAPSEAKADRRSVWTGLISLLRSTDHDGALLVAIDDVQWLDRGTALALEYAFRRLEGLSVRILLARRSEAGEPPPLGLATALQPKRVTSVRLGPMTLGGLHTMVKQRLGLSLRRPALVRLERASGGNPFFALEIARILAASGPDQPNVPLELPDTLTSLLRRRIAGLTPETRRILAVAAAASAPTTTLLDTAIGDGEPVARALEEGEEAGVVEVVDGRVQFSHPLLASSLFGTLRRGAKREIHRAIARASSDAEEAARHLALADDGPEEAVAGALEAAAGLARQRADPVAAAELMSLAVARTPPSDEEARGRRELDHAQFAFESGDWVAAETVARGAIDHLTPGPMRARGLILLGSIEWYGDRGADAITSLSRASREAGDDRALRGLAEARLTIFFEDKREAVQHGRAAMALLDPEHDPGPLSLAMLETFWSEVLLGRRPDLELLTSGIDLEPPGSTWEGSTIPGLWHLYAGDLDEARRFFRTALQQAREAGDDSSDMVMLAYLAEAELLAGEWTAADAIATEAVSAAETIGVSGPSLATRIRSLVDVHLGRFEAARAASNDALAGAREGERLPRALHHWIVGLADLWTGQPGAAVGSFTRARSELDSLGQVEPIRFRLEPEHVEAAVAAGDRAVARAELARLEERAKRIPRAWIDAALPRARALVLAAEGAIDEAATILAEALEGPGLVQASPFDRGRALLVLGGLHRRQKQKQSAHRALSRAVEAFEQLKGTPWASRARTELARVGIRPAAGLALTPTEEQVARLAATGLTNRQVAERLFLSPRTVEDNLARAYRKLGIRSRAELGRRMADRGDATA